MAKIRELRWTRPPDVQETHPEDLMVRGEIDAGERTPHIGEAIRVPGRAGIWRVDRLHASGQRGGSTYLLELGVYRVSSSGTTPWRRVKRDTGPDGSESNA